MTRAKIPRRGTPRRRTRTASGSAKRLGRAARRRPRPRPRTRAPRAARWTSPTRRGITRKSTRTAPGSRRRRSAASEACASPPRTRAPRPAGRASELIGPRDSRVRNTCKRVQVYTYYLAHLEPPSERSPGLIWNLRVRRPGWSNGDSRRDRDVPFVSKASTKYLPTWGRAQGDHHVGPRAPVGTESGRS